MTVTTNVDKIKINLLTQDQYDSMTINPNELYFITDSDTRYVKASEVSDVGYTGNYEDIINTPNFANVATSGSYTDLSNKPTISTVGSTGEYSDLLNKPTIDQTFNDSSSNSQSGIAIKNYLDSTVVHLSGDEEIEGVKSFNNTAEFAAGKGIKIKSNNANEYWNIRSSGGQSTGCALMKNDDTDYNAFKAENDHINIGSANILPYSVTPDTSDNSTRIATTAFVKAQGYAVDSDVVHKTGNETISGEKTFLNSDGKLYISRSDVTKGTTPTTTKYYNFCFCDKDGTTYPNNCLAYIAPMYTNNGDITMRIAALKPVAGSGSSVVQFNLTYPASGNPYAETPPFANSLFLYESPSKTTNGVGVIKLVNSSTDCYLRLTTRDSLSSTDNSKYLDIHKTSITTNTPATDDNSTQIATTAFVKAQGYLTKHQSLSNYVTLNGSQTISGTKTFSNVVTASLKGSITGIMDVTKGTNPTSSAYCGLLYCNDKTNSSTWKATRLGVVETSVTSAGDTSLYFAAYQFAANASNNSMICVKYYANGTRSVEPSNDNATYLGVANKRWKQLYAGTTTINTSDERLKQQITNIPDEVLDVWGKVNFCQFKFNDAVEEKGNNARLHTGLIAQRIKEVFEENNLDPFVYGLLCYDEWKAEDPIYDENNEVYIPGQKAGNIYSLRYEECLCMEAAYQRRRADRLEEKLEKRLKKIEKLLEIDE